MPELPKFNFAIIKHRGDLNHAKTADGYSVHREKRVYIVEQGKGRWVYCAPDSEHFVFIDPAWKRGKVGRWFAMCSCGSAAVITGYNAYANYGSSTDKEESTVPGEMLICLEYLTNGKHLPISKDRE